MNKEDLRKEYTMLYKYMASSSNPDYMKAFGAVMNEMMDWMIANKSESAEAWVERLSAIKWNNYLTAAEAEAIVNSMEPAAPWKRDVWRQKMASLNLGIEEEPCYNKCALWAVMSMIYSDSALTIAKLIGGNSVDDIDESDMIKAVHALAIDKLKDSDGRFRVRRYFGLS